MARSVKPLFGTSTTFVEGTGTSDYNGVKIISDYPPGAQNVASIFINPSGGGGNVTVTVKCQFYSGVAWGPLHNVKDEDGANVTFQANATTAVEANLYAQSWWKENDGFRIVLSRASSTALGGTATAVIR